MDTLIWQMQTMKYKIKIVILTVISTIKDNTHKYVVKLYSELEYSSESGFPCCHPANNIIALQ